MSIGMIAFWALIIFTIVWIARGRPSGQEERARERPDEVLKRRLASGEITLDEYEELRSALDRHANGPSLGDKSPASGAAG
jgi:putative membrane protein